VFKHPLIIVGVVVAVGGWLFLTSGVAGGSIGSRDIINLHAISLAENVILLGYMTALAGLIAGGFDAVIKGKTHLPTSPSRRAIHGYLMIMTRNACSVR